MAKEMTMNEWTDWQRLNRSEIETNHPDWNASQVSRYLHILADIFEGQGLICRPANVRWM